MPEPRMLFSRRRRAVAFGTVAVLVASLLTYWYVEREITGGRDVAIADAVRLNPVKISPVPLPADGGTWAGPAHATWPAPGSAELSVGSARKVGGLPVAVRAKAGKKAPGKVRVSVLDQRHSEKLGVSGPVVTVDGDPGEFEAAFDYGGFSQLYGGDWAGRLSLRQLPACAATTPELPQCQDTSRLPVTKPAASTTMSTDLATTGAGPTVLAVSADTESDEGDYKASDLQASGSWTVGDGSGGFTYQNPIRIPPAAGPTPEVSLGYSSQMVDGRMAGRNNQASWAGDGWDYSPGLVERTYVTCVDDRDKVDGKEPNNKDNKTADQCWKDDSPSITASLGGTNTTLIKDDASGVWHAQQDTDWKIELEGAAATKDTATTERWIITTPDGRRHYFASEPDTADSRWTLPVFGNHDGEKCHASAFKDSSCQQAWRWLLDKTVDVNGNMTRYYYKDETGHYGAADDKNNRVSFTRGGYLDRVEYGLHTAYPDVAATGRVVFSVADRCMAEECYKDEKPVKANWPDVPWDKECAAEPCTDKLAPVFFSTKRLTKITTQIRNGSSFDDGESWALNQEFKAPKSARSASLWLKEIVHTGHVGGALSDPPVRFTGVELANRVNAAAGAPLFSRWRVDNIRTESGADIKVTYSDADCDSNDLPSASDNARLCYPVYWTPDGYFDPTRDWFRKYVVREITEYDRTADQPPVTRTYDYSTQGGGTSTLWAYDDSEFTKKKHRTYGQWRGYARVITRTGAPDKPKLTVRKQFYRGLDDQPLPDDKTRSVTVTDSEGNTYSDHPTLAGFGLEEATLDGDTVIEAKTTAFWTRQTASRERTGGTDRAYVTGPSVEKTRKLLAPGAWQRAEKRVTYDDEGHPETVSDLGDTGKTGDETCTTTTYVANKDVWLRGLVSRVETVAKACGATVSRPGDVVADVKTYYDGSATHGSTPTKGQQTRQDTLDHWDDKPVYTTTSATTYDDLGRQKSTTDANGQVTTTSYLPAGPGPVTQTTTKNPKQHTVVTDQNPAWAEPTSILDANKKRTTLQHDPMGRLTKVWLPGRALNKTPNLEFDYKIRADGPLAVTTRRLGPNGNQITEIGLFDSLYRSVQTQEDALGGTRLVDTTGYDDKGQVAYKSERLHAEGVPGIDLREVTPGEDRHRTVTDYDTVGRVISESLWSANKKLWATTTAYGGNPNGWQTTVTPPRGESASATIANVDGDTIELREFHGGKPEGDYDPTTYTYTPRGDLATVTKGKAVWRYEYDLRGREVKTVDPDKGATVVEYNNADDITQSTDASGNVVTTKYDELGRQIERAFNGKIAATWQYDTLAKGHPTKSVSKVNGYDFVHEVYEYNDAYQIIDEESVIPAMPGMEKLAGTYVTTHSYRVNGSKDRDKLPKVGPMSAEMISNTYDDVGNVVMLLGSTSLGESTTYVEQATYSPYGEVLKRKLGVKSKPQGHQSYVYDDVTRRLKEFYFDRDGTVPNVAALKYDYDDAGNVLSIANRPLGPDETPRPGEEDVQCFRYDHLRRLTQAWSQDVETCPAAPTAEAIGGVAPYWKSWSFNEAGSRTESIDHQAGTTSRYAYSDGENAAQPHAVRTVTSGSRVEHYDWSKTGNLTYRKIGDVSETFTWSPHGKLTTISGQEGDTTMVYDVDGDRIARIDPDGTATAYVSGHEFTSSTNGLSTTRYYEHAGDTIASRTDSSAGGKGDVIWLGADQHDSAAWAVNSRTRVSTVRYNDPYGNPRGNEQQVWPSGQRNFVGGVADPSGLTLLGARYYAPALGAFLSVDPEIEEYDPQRMHPFAYANNNPVTFADPDGLFWDSVKNGLSKAGNAVASAATSAAKAVVNNAGTIATVAGTVAMVATVLPPPAQVVAAAAGAVAAVAGAIDTVKTFVGGDKMGCAMGLAGMVPGVRQAKTAARGAGAAKNAAKNAQRKIPKGCNSFLPGTPVLMADGSTKPIEDIELDDVVWAFDPESGEEGARPVTALITGSGDKKLIDVTIDANGDGASDGKVTATDGHPFWVDDERVWLAAKHLKPGQQLLTPDGARVTVLAIVAYGAVATVHNLTIDDIHTYHVVAGDAPVLIHNDSCPDDDDLVTVFHYTDKRGYNGIRSGNPYVIKPGKSKHGPGPFFSRMSPANLKEPGAFKRRLGVTAPKSEYVMELRVPKSSLKPIRGGRGGNNVLTIPGGLVIPRFFVRFFGLTRNWKPE